MNHLDDFTLNEYLDFALDESARAEAATHLQACADCRARLEELQMLFTELEDLPEAHLEHDLTPGILVRLPRKEPARTTRTWTRAFAAQLGVVIGFFFWLGMQIVPLIRTPQSVLSNLPTIEIRTLLMRLLSLQISIPEFQFPVFNYQIPTINFQLPTLSIQISTANVIALAISTLLFWVVGNVILLRGRQETES